MEMKNPRGFSKKLDAKEDQGTNYNFMVGFW